uniref:Uncharacterized protein n=1 Tax=Amphimedon queenslandica TaxID=400682 RepID=A0A1X7TYH0_AMPQE
MSTKPEELKRAFDRELNISDFRLVWEKAGVLSGRWDSIGILLGISYNKLYEIEAGGKPPRTCLQKVFDCWLKKDYDYKSHGVPTLRILCHSIKSNSGGADPALADEIAKEFNLTVSGEATTSPVHTSPSKATPTVELPVPTQSEPSYVKKLNHFAATNGLTRLIEDLQDDFIDNMHLTKMAFHSLDLSEVVDHIQSYIATLLSPRFRKRQIIESMRDDFDELKTMKQLFRVLEKYVSWFNFELVVKLINTFITDDRDLQRKWSTYREKLKDYFKNNNTKAVQIADSIEFGLCDVPGTKVMTAKVARDDYTLNDLYFFHKLIADALEVPDYNFYFCTIQNGCMVLKYSIPDFLYPVLFPLTNQQCDSLAEIGIIKITCHEYVHDMKQLPENELKKLHDFPIDIYDPLWYENTSTPLNEACWRGLKDEVPQLIDKTGLQEKGKNGWSPSLAASYGGHIDVLCLLIDVYHCDLSQGDDDGVISLHMASYKGHLNIAQYLVNECHVDPDIADSSCNTGLLYSALGGHVDLVIMFLKKKCNVSQVNREGSTLSLLACKSGQVALVDQLKQFDIFSEDDIDFNGCGIVHYCAMSDSVELLEYLNDNHKSELFQKRDRFGATPLHIACQYASSGFIMKMASIFGYKVLLEADYSGRSSLHYLCNGLVDKYCITEVYNKLTAPCDIPLLNQIPTFKTENIKVLQRYISLSINVTKQHKRVSLLSTLFKKASFINNFNINSVTATGQSLVHLACTSGSILLVKVLEEYGINTSSLDYEGRSAVHYAALSGSPTLLSYTVSQYSLNASQPDYKGVVPLALACMAGSINAVEYIRNTTDIDINITCNEGRTPLLYSCRQGNIDLSQYLIEVQDSDINITDNNKWNALTHSAESGNMKLVEYLINNHQLPLTSFELFQAVLNEFKLDPQVKAGDGMQAVHFAAEVGAIDVLDLLHTTDDIDALPIHYACGSGVIQLVTFLIDVMKCDVTTKHKNHLTCVTRACFSGNLDLIKLLIKQYNLNPRIFGRSSSPEAAVGFGHFHILEWLRQEYHINVSSFKNVFLSVTYQLKLQMDQQFFIYHSGNKDLIKFLVESHGLDPESQDKDGVTCLHIIAKQGDKEIYEYLVPRVRNNPTPKDKAGRSPLHYAGRHYEMSVYLVQSFNIHPEDKDSNGFTGVHAACRGGNIQLVSHYLSNLKCDKNVLTNSSKGLLYFACRSGNLELVRILIDKFDLVPVQGDIDGARSVNAESIVKFLEARISLSKLVREFVDEAEKRQLVPIATKPRPSFLSS